MQFSTHPATSSQCAFSQIKVVSQFEECNEQPAFSSRWIYKSYMRQLKRKRNESVLLVWATDRYLLGCSRSRDSIIHSAGDTVKEVVSITSLSNLQKHYSYRHQNKHHWCGNQEKHCSVNTDLHITIFNITTETTCGRNGLYVFECF